MAQRKSRGKDADHARDLCLAVVIDHVTSAASLARTASTLMEAGDGDRAFAIALDIEPLLRDANTALQAASMFRRKATET